MQEGMIETRCEDCQPLGHQPVQVESRKGKAKSRALTSNDSKVNLQSCDWTGAFAEFRARENLTKDVWNQNPSSTPIWGRAC